MIVVWLAIVSWWRARLRRIDIEILWPSCKREAAAHFDESEALDYAKAMFALHAFKDPAWTSLGEDMIVSVIEALK